MAALANKRHEKFCHEYIKDMNAKQAAIRTGYSEKSAESQSSRLLRNDKVKKGLPSSVTPTSTKTS